MKDLFSKKVILGLIAAFILGSLGAVLYKSQTDNFLKDTTTTTINLDDKIKDNDTTTSSSSTTVPQKPEVVPTEPGDTADLKAQGGWITAQKKLESADIDVTFYFEGSGAYTVQKKTASGWENVVENIFYPGSGGLKVLTLAANESTVTVRGLKNENGVYTSVTKEFTVVRSEVESEGLKTYN